MKTGVQNKIPLGSWLYSAMSIGSAVLIMTGLHRPVIVALSLFIRSDIVVAVIAGALNLSWHEFAYTIGKPLKSVAVFTFLPFVYSLVSIISAAVLSLRMPISRAVVKANLSLGIVAAVLSLIIIFLKGESDTWRITTCLSLLVANFAWLYYFRRGK